MWKVANLDYCLIIVPPSIPHFSTYMLFGIFAYVISEYDHSHAISKHLILFDISQSGNKPHPHCHVRALKSTCYYDDFNIHVIVVTLTLFCFNACTILARNCNVIYCSKSLNKPRYSLRWNLFIFYIKIAYLRLIALDTETTAREADKLVTWRSTATVIG